MIYLDNNATTMPGGAVSAAVMRGLTEFWPNPSSVHRPGQAARQQVELARAAVAQLVGAKPRDVVFTGSGTEAIDLAIRGVLSAAGPGPQTLLTTRTEHAAVRDLAEALEKSGQARVGWIPLAMGGLVDLAALEGLLKDRPRLVSVQWANNETGVVQPVAEISRLCRAAGALFHCDGTQWVGKMPAGAAIELFDLLTFSPHKFHGPKGVGVLYIRRGTKLRPTVAGTQEMGRRGGTENVPGILGAGEAAREATAWLGDASVIARGEGLRDRLEGAILSAVPGAVVNGRAPDVPRLWNTSNIGFPRLEAEAIVMGLSERGVCVSAGAACSSGSLEPSPVLLAMGIPPEIAHGSIRFSLSRHTTAAEIDQAAGIVAEVVARLRGSMGSLSAGPCGPGA